MENIQNHAEIWDKCLDLAIDSFNAKSLAIASVITNSAYEIVAFGSNQLRDNRDRCNRIALSTIAHAETNAIHNLGLAGMDGKDFTLFTTVEPCPMCMGAISLSRIKKVIVGSRDPYTGSTQWVQSNTYISRKNITILFEKDYFEKLFFKLHYLSIKRELKDRPDHKIFELFKDVYGNDMKDIEELIKGIELNELLIDREWIEKNI